jgi:hypothetical protein
VSIETVLMVPRLLWLAYRQLPVRAPIRRRLVCWAGRLCDDNLAVL